MSKKNNYLYYLFPRRCAVCARVISHDTVLCDDCKQEIKPIDSKICISCGLPKKECVCAKYVYHFRGVVSPYINSGAARRSVYGYKFAKNYDAAEFLAKKMAISVLTNFSDISFDCVTFVPMHWHKKYITGFDYVNILARRCGAELRLPVKRLLIKKKRNIVQHTLSHRERFNNVKNAFVAKHNNYKNVLLIDDIKTTGATLDECARQLMLAGAENVYCVTAVIGSCKTEEG